jgi:hypothetical protein
MNFFKLMQLMELEMLAAIKSQPGLVHQNPVTLPALADELEELGLQELSSTIRDISQAVPKTFGRPTTAKTLPIEPQAIREIINLLVRVRRQTVQVDRASKQRIGKQVRDGLYEYIRYYVHHYLYSVVEVVSGLARQAKQQGIDPDEDRLKKVYRLIHQMIEGNRNPPGTSPDLLRFGDPAAHFRLIIRSMVESWEWAAALGLPPRRSPALHALASLHPMVPELEMLVIMINPRT